MKYKGSVVGRFVVACLCAAHMYVSMCSQVCELTFVRYEGTYVLLGLEARSLLVSFSIALHFIYGGKIAC